MTLRENVGRRVQVGAPDDCWEYDGNHDKDGYSQITVRFPNKRRRNFRISRFLLEWKLERSLYPKAYACHTCDNPRCVNLAHIYEGDHKSNTRDSVVRNRRPRGAAIKTNIRLVMDVHPELQVRGETHGRAKLTSEQVLEIRCLRREEGTSWPKLAKLFGVSQRAIRSILDGTNWKHLPM